jgi:hypothetical protein
MTEGYIVAVRRDKSETERQTEGSPIFPTSITRNGRTFERLHCGYIQDDLLGSATASAGQDWWYTLNLC